MNQKLLKRLLCAFLSVLMLVCAIPAIALPTAAATTEENATIDYTVQTYESAKARVEAMGAPLYSNGEYELYCDQKLGIVAYRKVATDEVLFTNPWNMAAESKTYEDIRKEIMAQIQLTYKDDQNQQVTLNSYVDAALKDQITVKLIKNGIRVEYAIGELSSRILLPRWIEKSRFQALLAEFAENVPGGKGSWEYRQFSYYYRPFSSGNDAHEAAFPVLKKYDDMTIYVIDTSASETQLRDLEAYVKAYLPDYSFEDMDNDHDQTEYEEDSMSPPLFKMALEYTIDGNGLSVSLPANGLRYDESVYRISQLQILPYMGASLKTSEGYTFVPDGSGALYSLSTPVIDRYFNAYGTDYSIFNLLPTHSETVRVPVYGQVEINAEGEKRGFMAVIEEGDALASISPSHLTDRQHTSAIVAFTTRQSDMSQSNWAVYAYRRYTNDYKIRYTILSDDTKAQNAGLTQYYECSWMGMACAYRDYLDGKDNGFERLSAADVDPNKIPLYIETFGCMDTVEKVFSMPVTVSVALTSFENVRTMYDYLASEGVTNVNFKLKGYANGGLYADVPYKLKWEKAVGGSSGFKDLAAYAKEKGFEIYPDFDFVFTSQSDAGSAVSMKKNAARTIENRYTARRVYSATQQTLISYYQMVLSPATYDKFYEKLAKKYAKYEDATGVSLSTLGGYLNSDFDEDKTVLREETKQYVVEALAHFKKDYNVMVEGGNSYTWHTVDHILGVPLDSSRYNAEYASVPFVGVILHGYVEFAGSAFNMEGDLKYAMLKAMENGASAYFVLSYANTQLLKEDELLSQNYSVRYDIWQKRLVEVYNELNDVLADVQTLLIVNHQFLEESSRIPDEDELLKDIADAAKEQADKIKEKIEADRLAALEALREAKNTADRAPDVINTEASDIAKYLKNIHLTRPGSEYTDKEKKLALANSWNTLLDAMADTNTAPTELLANAKSLSDNLRNYLIDVYFGAVKAKQDAEKALSAAKVALEHLKSVNADAVLIRDASASLDAAITEYVAVLAIYDGRAMVLDDAARANYLNNANATLADLKAAILPGSSAPVVEVADADLVAFLLENDTAVSAQYAAIGVDNLYKAYKDLLIKQGIYNESDPASSLVNLKALEDAARSELDKEEDDQAPAHNFSSSWSYDALYHWHVCTDDNCTEIADKAEHTWENKTNAEGETVPTCSGCGMIDTGDLIAPDAAKDKYSIDNKVVLISFGESKDAPYKSLILNFNDYAIQTTCNGVTYTIEGYGYVVIYH